MYTRVSAEPDAAEEHQRGGVVDDEAAAAGLRDAGEADGEERSPGRRRAPASPARRPRAAFRRLREPAQACSAKRYLPLVRGRPGRQACAPAPVRAIPPGPMRYRDSTGCRVRRLAGRSAPHGCSAAPRRRCRTRRPGGSAAGSAGSARRRRSWLVAVLPGCSLRSRWDRSLDCWPAGPGTAAVRAACGAGRRRWPRRQPRPGAGSCQGGPAVGQQGARRETWPAAGARNRPSRSSPSASRPRSPSTPRTWSSLGWPAPKIAASARWASSVVVAPAGRERLAEDRGGLAPGGAGVDAGAQVGGQAQHFVPAAADALGRVAVAETGLPAPGLQQRNQQQRQREDRHRDQRRCRSRRAADPRTARGCSSSRRRPARPARSPAAGRPAPAAGAAAAAPAAWAWTCSPGPAGSGTLSLGGVGSKDTQPTRSKATSTQAWTSLPVIFTSPAPFSGLLGSG